MAWADPARLTRTGSPLKESLVNSRLSEAKRKEILHEFYDFEIPLKFLAMIKPIFSNCDFLSKDDAFSCLHEEIYVFFSKNSKIVWSKRAIACQFLLMEELKRSSCTELHM